MTIHFDRDMSFEEMSDNLSRLSPDKMVATVMENLPPNDALQHMDTTIIGILGATLGVIMTSKSDIPSVGSTLAGHIVKAIWWQGWKAACKRMSWAIAEDSNEP